MKLKELSMQDCEQVRIWRNECLESLRTPFPLTKEMQEQFYREVVCNRDARARYWGIWVYKGGCNLGVDFTECEACAIDGCSIKEKENLILIGMVGLENIEWENRRGEISIILGPEYRKKGYGTEAVEVLLEQGFMYLNLENIWGECYISNPAVVNFWAVICTKYKASWINIPNTKFYNGTYYGSQHFTINKEEWVNCHR
jgi:RimJ/RimL family protein N-acetyltransferase